MSNTERGCVRLLYTTLSSGLAKGPWSPSSSAYEGASKLNCRPSGSSLRGEPAKQGRDGAAGDALVVGAHLASQPLQPQTAPPSSHPAPRCRATPPSPFNATPSKLDDAHRLWAAGKRWPPACRSAAQAPPDGPS